MNQPDAAAVSPSQPPLLTRLLPINSAGYYVFLGLIAVFILGPLGGVTAAYMNFSLGFFVGGQVLAGILGSVVTYFYGPEGKHGANYMQTAAASVASMAAMGVLIQAMVWLGLPEPETWKLILYFLCVGMFGIGVGMLYTPILVDKLQLTYPSGLAVANILRALTDVKLLKRSVGQLFSGIGIGAALPLAMEKIPSLASLAATGISTSTIGAAMIVGARITVPAMLYALVLDQMTPWFRAMGWLGEHDPYRKFAFLIALGMIMGAAMVDISLILKQAVEKLRGVASPGAQAAVPEEAWKKTNMNRLYAFVAAAGVAVIFVSNQLLSVPLGWVLFAVAFSFLMMLVNGISLGITDSNPISTAFVLSVISMAAMGLVDPIAGLLAGSIVFVVCSIGGDMQQDRSTGWRLGTNRTVQFRFQLVGVVLGAVLAVFMAKVFMEAYPVLKVDIHSHPEAKVAQWQSAMTYKFVGALRGITAPKSWQMPAILVGLAIGLVTEIARKAIKGNARYQAWIKSKNGFAFDFTLDAVLLPSPYASSFAGFVELLTSLWWGAGGVFSSIWNTVAKRAASKETAAGGEIPDDMSTTSLVGGGLIAGDSIAALVLGVMGLVESGALGKIFGGQAALPPPEAPPPAPAP